MVQLPTQPSSKAKTAEPTKTSETAKTAQGKSSTVSPSLQSSVPDTGVRFSPGVFDKPNAPVHLEEPDPYAPNWGILTQEWDSDEPELETDFHRAQIDLLLRLMQWYWRHQGDVYCSGNTTVYYDEDQLTTRNFRGPDIFVVMGVDPRPRRSWMIWKEGGKYPDVVFELLSPSTAKTDRTTKKTLYQDIWRLPNYFWFHPDTKEFEGFKLVDHQYQAIEPNALGHLWSDQMELFVGLHEGMLRLFSRSGELIPLEEEEAQAEAQQAQAEAQQAQERADLLAQKLRELGVDPDAL